MAETQPLKITMQLATLTESVTVTGAASTELLKTGTVAATYKTESLERLPVGRTLVDVVTLAPGVVPNGPQQSDGSRNIVMSGALSYENLFLVNGVTVNENLRGQALLLYIEDAIQETKISTGGISAEYGRFQGGVVNMVTKSGGDIFSGSFRTSFTNDAWRALTPFPGDQVVSSLTPTYEATAAVRSSARSLVLRRLALQRRATQPDAGFHERQLHARRERSAWRRKATWALNALNSLRRPTASVP